MHLELEVTHEGELIDQKEFDRLSEVVYYYNTSVNIPSGCELKVFESYRDSLGDVIRLECIFTGRKEGPVLW